MGDLTNAWIDTQLCQLDAASQEERDGYMAVPPLPRVSCGSQFLLRGCD
jgi:hypothetical protein